MMNTQQQVNHSENIERIVSAMERVLRPFIRLFVGRVSCGFMIQRMKRVYIEEARSWIEKNEPDGRVTKSKLAMLTGLDTRTITSIESSPSLENAEAELCAEASVLTNWSHKADYQNEDGTPKILPIAGKGPTFQTLVTSSVGRNVTYHTVLEKLIDSENVEIVDENHLKMISINYMPLKANEQTIIDSGTASIGRLIRTVQHNFHSENKLTQQDRWTTTIPCEKIPDVQKALRDKLATQIVEIEQIILDYEIIEDGKTPTCTIGIGWFMFN